MECGKTSLTVSAQREKDNDTTINTGPLVVADQGTCCIDELDKMSNSNEIIRSIN